MIGSRVNPNAAMESKIKTGLTFDKQEWQSHCNLFLAEEFNFGRCSDISRTRLRGRHGRHDATDSV
jgi:hypothetical protein